RQMEKEWVRKTLVILILAVTNLKGANFQNTKVENARLWHDSGLSDEMKQDLISRGAFFEDN
ncbi:MAG: hypothetical protein F6K13_31675, partial [Okeania sp. SIO2B9]|nr:hypothetical protein [Okeania sp. SIO2B9]